MNSSQIKLSLLILVISIVEIISAQDINIKERSENIQIKNDTLFLKKVTVFFKKSPKQTIYPIFYDFELEDISDIKVFVKKGKRFKLLQKTYITEDNVKLGYITSKRIKSIKIPAEVETKVTYTISCNELKYFSNLPFFTYDNVDTLKYQITIPEAYHLFYDKLYVNSLEHLTMDSLRLDGQTIWNIEVVPERVEPDLLTFFGIYRNLKVPILRIAVIPAKEGNKKEAHLNNWFLDKVETRRGLDSIATNKVNEITIGLTDTTDILNTLYGYIKTNFKYVAIEVGMGAFIPTHANEVFINKQGDCKDLSNLLSEMLNYKGIDSYVALAATYDHISDCDFPSLCSANHVICVAYINGMRIILDPTDPIHLPGTPVESLQERTIFIINLDGGEYYKLNSFPPQKNQINYEIELNGNFDNLRINGNFETNYTGISGNFLKRMLFYMNENERNNLTEKHYESIFANQAVELSSINTYSDTIAIKGELDVDGKILKDKNSWFLFLDFLPRLIETENRQVMLEGTYLGSTVHKKVKLTIKMDEPFETISPIEHTFSNKGIALNLIITHPSESIIECTYEFILNYIFIQKENIENVNEILKSFKEIINEPIILKSKN